MGKHNHDNFTHENNMLVIFGNLQKFSENVRKWLSRLQTTFGESSEIFRKNLEIFRKLSKKSSLGYLYKRKTEKYMAACRYRISLLAFNLISHKWAQQTLEISSWTLKEKFPIYVHHVLLMTNSDPSHTIIFLLYSYNKDSRNKELTSMHNRSKPQAVIKQKEK